MLILREWLYSESTTSQLQLQSLFEQAGGLAVHSFADANTKLYHAGVNSACWYTSDAPYADFMYT